MKKSVKKNYIYNLTYQILLIILPLITTPYLSRTLGANGIGVYSYTVSIVTYFILFGSLGVAMYGQREIAYVQNDMEKRSKVFWELVFLRFLTLSISSLFFYFIFARSGEYAVYFRILLLEILANCFDISWFYQGLEDFKKIVIRNFIVKIISVLAIFIFIKGPEDVGIYIFIYAFSTLFGSLTLWFGVFSKIERPHDLNLKRHFVPVLALFIPQIAIQVYTVLDKTMLGSILGNMSEVGFYEQAQKIIKLFLTIITALGTVMMPRIAKYFADGKTEEIKTYMKNTFHFIFILAVPLMFGVIVTSRNFVPLFFGSGYEKVPTIMSILSLIILFISMSNVTGTQYLLPTKRQREFTISVVMGAGVNFLLNLIMIPKFQSYGAAIATVAAEFVVTSVQLYFVRQEFSLREILSIFKNYFLAGILMFLVCFGVDFFIEEYHLSMMIQVVCGVVVYFGTLLLLRDSFLLTFLSSFKKEGKK